MNKIVKIKLVDKKGSTAFNGFVRYKNTKDYITSYYDSRGVLYTGLTKEDEVRLGEALSRDLSPQSPYWHEYSIVMTDKVKELDTSSLEHELAYLFLTGGHKRIANSITDPNIGICDYYIVDDNKEAEVINAKASFKIKANKIFSGLSTENKKDILKLYPGFTNVNSVSSEVIEAKLYELLEKDPARFIEQAEDKKRDTKLLLKDLVSTSILRKNKSSYYYGEDFIGHDEETTITYLDSPDRQDLKVDLMSQLKTKVKK